MFRPVTVYQVICDAPACALAYEFDDDGDRFELRVDTPDLTTWAASMREDGWLIGSDVLCPRHAGDLETAMLDRLGVEMSQDALWDGWDVESCGDPADDARWWRLGGDHGLPPGRPIETVPISIDQWPPEGER